MARRNKLEILGNILDICKERGSSKTRIVYQANLNFRTVKPYLDLLIQKDLIKVKPGKKILYETTERGRELLDYPERMDDGALKTA